MTELKPCPFCGGEAEVVEIHPGMLRIVCNSCLARSGWLPDGATRGEAIEAWNTRQPLECEASRPLNVGRPS